jgi:CO/xanthine dehydrogenase Mo-binding subunit
VKAGLVEVCAEELGVAPDRNHGPSADTATTPYDMGAQGS